MEFTDKLVVQAGEVDLLEFVFFRKVGHEFREIFRWNPGSNVIPQVQPFQFHHFVEDFRGKRVVQYGLFKTLPVQVCRGSLAVAHAREHPPPSPHGIRLFLFQHGVYHDVYDREVLRIDRIRVIEVHGRNIVFIQFGSTRPSTGKHIDEGIAFFLVSFFRLEYAAYKIPDGVHFKVNIFCHASPRVVAGPFFHSFYGCLEITAR